MGNEDDEVAQLNMVAQIEITPEEVYTSGRRASKQLFMTAGINVMLMPATPIPSPLSHAYPEIISKPTDLDVVVGNNAEFQVTLKNCDNDTVVSWTKNGILLLTLGRIQIWNDGNTFFLRIKQVEETDEGMYECRIRNNVGEIMCDASLAVYTSDIDEDENDEDEVEEFENILNQEELCFEKKLEPEYVVYQGNSVNLEVQTNISPITVAWYYGENKLVSTDDIQLITKGNIHRLFIKESLVDDEGYYKCVVQNDSEKISTETTLIIEG